MAPTYEDPAEIVYEKAKFSIFAAHVAKWGGGFTEAKEPREIDFERMIVHHYVGWWLAFRIEKIERNRQDSRLIDVHVIFKARREHAKYGKLYNDLCQLDYTGPATKADFCPPYVFLSPENKLSK
jgi:hypothetical protein